MNTIGNTDFYDAELHRHNVHFRAAAAVRPRDRVLDVGCGTGQTTREAARAAVDGSAVGVDVSAPMLERARRLSREQGLHNVSYQHGDAADAAIPNGALRPLHQPLRNHVLRRPRSPHSPTSVGRCAPVHAWC